MCTKDVHAFYNIFFTDNGKHKTFPLDRGKHLIAGFQCFFRINIDKTLISQSFDRIVYELALGLADIEKCHILLGKCHGMVDIILGTAFPEIRILREKLLLLFLQGLGLLLFQILFCLFFFWHIIISLYKDTKQKTQIYDTILSC